MSRCSSCLLAVSLNLAVGLWIHPGQSILLHANHDTTRQESNFCGREMRVLQQSCSGFTERKTSSTDSCSHQNLYLLQRPFSIASQFVQPVCDAEALWFEKMKALLSRLFGQKTSTCSGPTDRLERNLGGFDYKHRTEPRSRAKRSRHRPTINNYYSCCCYRCPYRLVASSPAGATCRPIPTELDGGRLGEQASITLQRPIMTEFGGREARRF